ncbi:hypothetical protein HS088_TW14G01124 [Tripterygium wilfordii]|uniref:SANT domain-containing protein n=1 Tax=Tripterygium wilfordii TaxID=458696 RepID=A0A7J7CSM6_TRIWF|nr:uncharacterized protein LOC120014283 [Tripterygium wilfordii]XP_038722126.1 uncharacterized protein LOC120014283 [Tripterygium wilfordii]KAF5736969.1 hypothetical protein HS088_TW14G01124 [Tripterygium wilfordii]
MDVDEVNYDEDSIEDESSRQVGVDGDPGAYPGIGDEHQVEIPPVMKKSDHLSLTNCSSDAEVLRCDFLKFLVGKPLSLVWICEKAKNIKREPGEFVGVATVLEEKDMPPLEYGCTRTKHIFTEGDESKAKVDTNIMSGDCVELRGPNEFFLRQDVKTEMLQNIGDKGYSLVPGYLDDTWSDREEASFLLGLYIFGKNLVQVKKFVETKSMGNILSFYYGKFYRSEKYCRWAGCRKISSSRRCIFGHKIFTGPRQQELSSRLLPRLSEQCQNTLEEVSKMFGEGKMSLEEYVVTLKAAVGLNALIEAVGIGNGKQDLTGIASEPLKSNQVGPARPEVPVGKACSYLTPLEIINFLTGDYRLSKARSNDLFWEAVWPRLLVRGWHSEQPNDNGCAAITTHSLVFLVPGIKKFSRRKLVKGNHYFNSVTDVLTKVASDPTLLELELEADKSYSSKGENGWTNGTNSVQDNSPDQHRHCYLKPRTPNRDTEVMKYTVVDTSLPAYGETFKVREMRSLPVELPNISTSRSQSVESDENSDGASSVAGGQHDKPKSRVLFDLNVAAVPNAEADDPSLMEMTGKHDEEGTKANEHCMPEISACMTQPSSMNSRRHSTRNRPPTARALEALAFGFLSLKPKRKSRDAFSPESSISRPHRARAKFSVMEDSITDVIDDVRGKSICNSNSEVQFDSMETKLT